MAVLLAEGAQHLQTAFTSLDERRSKLAPPATEAADAAVKSQRNLERIYRQAAGDLLEVTDIRVVTARREFYRRISAISDDIVAVASRIWYSQVEEALRPATVTVQEHVAAPEIKVLCAAWIMTALATCTSHPAPVQQPATPPGLPGAGTADVSQAPTGNVRVHRSGPPSISGAVTSSTPSR